MRFDAPFAWGSAAFLLGLGNRDATGGGEGESNHQYRLQLLVHIGNSLQIRAAKYGRQYNPAAARNTVRIP
jgi:hypothetical protein